MKKIFTTMLALVAAVGMAFTASAQEDSYFDCFVNGEKVNNGDRINITNFYEELSVPGYGVYQRQYNTHLTVIPYVVDKMVASVSDFSNDTPLDDDWMYGANLSIQFCGLDGLCVPVSVGQTVSKSKEINLEEVDKAMDMQTEIVISMFGDAADGDFLKLDIKTEFTMTFQLDDQVTVLTFYVDQKGTDAAVEGIEADSNIAPVYYDLQGRQIDNPTNGLYIVKKGSKVTKEFIR